MTRVLDFAKAHLLLVLALIAVLALSAYFAIGALDHARKWDPERPAIVQPWMTNRFIAHSWQLPPEVMDDDLNLPRTRGGPMSLQAIADERGIPVEELIERVEEAIKAHQERIQ